MEWKQISTNGSTWVHLSSSEMKRLPKPRSGFERFAPQLIELAANDSSLRPKGFDENAARQELEEYLALESTVVDAKKQLALAQQTRFYHASNLWVLMLGIYRLAVLEAKNDADIRFAIAAFETFMSRPHKRHHPTPST